MGVCSAYFLTQSEEFRSGDLNVVVVEEGEIFGGASGKAAGFLARDWHDAATEVSNGSLATITPKRDL